MLLRAGESSKHPSRLPLSLQDKSTIQKYAAYYAREISDLLLRMPRALLLLLKTNDCLRSVDTCLGCKDPARERLMG